MIGPRSALFTPFENLGLIVIDEEHGDQCIKVNRCRGIMQETSNVKLEGLVVLDSHFIGSILSVQAGRNIHCGN